MKNYRFIRTSGSFGLIITGLLLGILVTAQVRSIKTTRALNPLSPYAALRDTRVSLAAENKLLSDANKSLSDEISASEKELKQTEYSNRQKVEKSDELKKQIGLTPLGGEGIMVTLADADNNLADSNSIAHAADMRDLINLLWANGATAISINDQRIVATTSIDCIINTVMINNVRTVPPFDIRAIGDRRRMAEAVKDENKLSDIYDRVKNEGLVFQITEQKKVEVPAYSGTFIVEYAK
ncbi:MAG TPA: DUF881 domain-containing protein [Patescibacteria group bacterium]|nr:DUF881 domain-containing protein [Patescibacteria group bacterium]